MAVQNVANAPIGSYPVLVDRNTAGSDMQIMRLDVGVGTAESRVSTSNPLPVTGTVTATIPNPLPVTGTFYQATQPISAVSLPALATGTNTIGNVGIIPQTSGGCSRFHLVSAASTNATNIKASAGQVFGWYIYNSNAAARKVAFHNTAGTPTAGASVVESLVIPATSGANMLFDVGITYSTGIAITTVTGLADSDSTAVAANDLIINIYYK